MIKIRYLNSNDDRNVISNIYEESWRYSYKGILPQEYLDSIPKGRWCKNFDRNGLYTLIMEKDGVIIGSASFCASRFKEYADYGEIVSIYLLPAYIGKGYGKQLFDTAVNELTNLGYKKLFLWVLEDNSRARRFYEAQGFTVTENILNDNIGGKDVREIQYQYIV